MKTVLLSLLLFCGHAKAEDAILQKVETMGGGVNDFVTELTFDKDLQSQGLIEFSKDYVQVDLKGANKIARREVVRVADQDVQSVILTQFSPDVVRARLMLKEKGTADKFKGRVNVEADGNVIRIRLLSDGAATARATSDGTEETAGAAENNGQEPTAVTAEDKPAAELLAGELKQMNPATATEKIGELAAPVKSEPASVAKTEAEIPVLTKAEAKIDKSAGLTTRLVMSLGVILVVAGGIILFSRQWAKRRSGLTQHHQIKVLTQYGLGPKKSLAIIRVAGESILIGITDHNITMIKSLALLDEDLPMEVPKQFDQELQHRAPSVADRVSFTDAHGTEVSKDKEDFSFGSVKDMVASRLREMRTL